MEKHWKTELAELRSQRNGFIAEADGKVNSNKAGLLEDEELRCVDELMAKAEAIEKSDRFKKLLEIEQRAKKVSSALKDEEDGDGYGRKTRSAHPSRMPTDGPRKDRRHNAEPVDEERYSDAFESMMRFGRNGLDEEQRSVIRTDFTEGAGMSQTRATGTSVALADGAALVPNLMADQITEALTMFTSLREMGATVINTQSGAPITFPGTDYASKTAYEVGEGATDSTEDTLAFSANEIPTHECITPLYYISRTLLNDAAYPITQVLQRMIVQSFDALLAKRTVYGTGANQMRGLITTLCANGDVVDTVSSTAFADVDFATMQANVGDAYKFNPTCKFAFSPEFAANRFYKLADTTGRYLYRQANNKPGEGINGNMWALLTSMGDTVSLPPTPAAAACTLGAVGSAATITAGRIVALYGDASLFVIRNIAETLVERFEQETGAIQRRAVAFRGVRRIGGGWTSASTSAATRPMVALRIKN